MLNWKEVLIIVLLGGLIFQIGQMVQEKPPEFTGSAIDPDQGQVSICLNHPPVISSIANQSLLSTDTLIIQVNATDDDNDTLTFFDDTSLFDINQTTGLISQTGFTVGTFLINITAQGNSSCQNNNATTVFTLIVTSVEEPAPPTPVPGGRGPSRVPEELEIKLDTFLDTEFRIVDQGDEVTIDVTMGEFLPNSDVDLTYTIRDEDGNILYTETEDRILTGTETWPKTFDTSEYSPGDYTITIDAIYEGKAFSSVEIFTIRGKPFFAPGVLPIPIVGIQFIAPLVLILIALIILLIVFIVWMIIDLIIWLSREGKYKRIIYAYEKTVSKSKTITKDLQNSRKELKATREGIANIRKIKMKYRELLQLLNTSEKRKTKVLAKLAAEVEFAQKSLVKVMLKLSMTDDQIKEALETVEKTIIERNDIIYKIVKLERELKDVSFEVKKLGLELPPKKWENKLMKKLKLFDKNLIILDNYIIDSLENLALLISMKKELHCKAELALEDIAVTIKNYIIMLRKYNITKVFVKHHGEKIKARNELEEELIQKKEILLRQLEEDHNILNRLKTKSLKQIEKVKVVAEKSMDNEILSLLNKEKELTSNISSTKKKLRDLIRKLGK